MENVLQTDSLKAYCIPLRGMKDGLHQFEFELDGSFSGILNQNWETS
ncbi:MAG: hypothetical protein IPK61_13360 [Saprospiraceae bacterium]|nr:hypothetical protein [Saprospiraceae bacterium]